MTEPNNASGTGVEEDNQPENTGSSISSLIGDAWENTADEILVNSSFDTELGKQMSRDAIRASRGEMSDEEFYDKYHRKVIEEFGVDKRPVHTGEDND